MIKAATKCSLEARGQVTFMVQN